jgi:hypothetical protein
MAYKNTVKAIALTNIASSTVTGSYQAINTSGLPNPCIIIRIINNSSKDVTVSYDGVNDGEFVPTMTTLQLPLQSNMVPNGNVAVLAQGTIVYVKGTAGTGNVYLAGYYLPTAL